jgi:hypothetical protein
MGIPAVPGINQTPYGVLYRAAVAHLFTPLPHARTVSVIPSFGGLGTYSGAAIFNWIQ